MASTHATPPDDRLESGTVGGVESAESRSRASTDATHAVAPDATKEKSPAASPTDDRLVSFDAVGIDTDNPLTWPTWKKWMIIAVVSTTSTCVTCTSSVVTTAYAGIERDLGVSHEVALLGLSLFVLGLGSGPLLLSPFSEFYGRRPVYLISLLVFFLLGFPVAFANNAAVFFIFRFLTGFAGSAFLSVAGGTVTDLYTINDSYFPMAVYTSSPFMGPVLGPVFSGFIIQFANWRWTFRVIIIWSFVQLVLVYFFTPETFAGKRLISKAERIRKQTGDSTYYAQHEKTLAEKSLTRTIVVSSQRVFLLLALEPMLLLLCLWCAVLLGILYLAFELFPIVFAKHDFSEYQNGLSFLGLGIGVLLGLICMYFFAARYKRQAAAHGGHAPPEARLDAAKLGAVLCPIGLLIFAFTSYEHVHWIAPIVGSIPFGIGFQLIFTSVFTFTTDNWRPVAASGMGANSVARSTFAAVFPLFSEQMAHRLTTVGAAGLLAGLNIVIIPLPFLFAHYGPRLRAKSKFALPQS